MRLSSFRRSMVQKKTVLLENQVSLATCWNGKSQEKNRENKFTVSQIYLVPIQTQKSTRSVLTVTRNYILRSNDLLLPMQPLHCQNNVVDLTYLVFKPLWVCAPTYLLLPLGKRGSKWGDFHWAMGCV